MVTRFPEYFLLVIFERYKRERERERERGGEKIKCQRKTDLVYIMERVDESEE